MSDETVNKIDLQDPLPESNWFWRRVLTFLAMLIVFGVMIGLGYAVHRIVGGVIAKIDEMSAEAVARITVVALGVIEQMFGQMYWALLVIVTYYMVAPSAEQITKIMKTASLLQGGVKMASRVTSQDFGREVETTTTAGKPTTPPAPETGLQGPETPAEAETPPDGAPGEPPWDEKKG